MAETDSPFDAVQPYEDLLVDWERRLEREAPFFQRAFSSAGAHRVLDCVCGTGRHVCLFARWGIDAVGSDLSPARVEAARRHARDAGAAVRFEVADFRRLPETFPQPFDAVICTGALPLAGSPDAMRQAIASMRDVLRPDGLLIVQCLNFEMIPEGRIAVHRLHTCEVDDREVLILKLFRKIRRRCDILTLVLDKHAGEWTTVDMPAQAWAVTHDELEAMLTKAGLGRIQRYGDYEPKPFDPATSPALILVARKAKD